MNTFQSTLSRYLEKELGKILRREGKKRKEMEFPARLKKFSPNKLRYSIELITTVKIHNRYMRIPKIHKLADQSKFWDYIEKIDWTSAIENQDAVDIAKKRYLQYVPTGEQKRFKQIYYMYHNLINQETNRRGQKGIESFARNVRGGADDTHFHDLPAHLIGRGKIFVEKYLDGWMVDEEAVECLSYIFYSDY